MTAWWSVGGRGRRALIGGGVFLAAYAATSLAIRAGLVQSASSGGASLRYAPTMAHTDGTQLVMVYVGSARCVWANDASAPALVERVKTLLEEEARRRGWSFETVGVGLDWDPADGLEHLRRFGRFDEVAAGYSWANVVVTSYFGGRLTQALSTPSVVVVRRRLIEPEPFAGSLTYRVVRLQVLVTKSGVDELRNWSEAGAPL